MQKTYDILIKSRSLTTEALAARLNTTPKGAGYVVKDTVIYPACYHRLKMLGSDEHKY